MCYTGACLYEDYTGECTIGNGYFPDDAWCQLPPEENEFKERELSSEEFDKRFDEGVDISKNIDWDKTRSPNKEHQNDETT